MALKLKGRRGLVTGSSSGIGEGIARMLSPEGCTYDSGTEHTIGDSRKRSLPHNCGARRKIRRQECCERSRAGHG